MLKKPIIEAGNATRTPTHLMAYHRQNVTFADPSKRIDAAMDIILPHARRTVVAKVQPRTP